MKDDNRIVELLADIVVVQKQMLEELRLMNKELQQTNKRLDNLERQQVKTNIAIADLHLSVMQLAEKFESVTQLDKRITRIEDSVFHV